MTKKLLSVADLERYLSPIRNLDLELFLHTTHNGKEYAGAFDTRGRLKGLCDLSEFSGYTDDEDYPTEYVTSDMKEILDYPENFQWWFKDPGAQANDLKFQITGLRSVVRWLTKIDNVQKSEEQ